MENGKRIDDFQTESDLRLAINEWLLSETRRPQTALEQLARILQRSHEDPWLSEALRNLQDRRANALLNTAIQANIAGNADDGLKKSKAAETVFARSRFVALAALADLQKIYALRRKSRAPDCIASSQSFLSTADKRRYSWIQVQVLLEESSCQGMLSDFEAAEQTGRAAMDAASKFQYPALKLRALGLLASLDTASGKLLQSWKDNSRGLAAFWTITFPPERGFQFYSEMDFLAEHESYWHLAASLEQEAITMLNGRKRYDYEAIARMKRAAACMEDGDLNNANREFQQAAALMALLPAAPRTLYRTDSEIALSRLEIKEGNLDSASNRLRELEPAVQTTKNFTVRLRYARAMAELDRKRSRENEETGYLREIGTIGQSGLRSLSSAEERWEWQREIDWADRRLMEIEVSKPHDPLVALAHWESMRSIDDVNISEHAALQVLKARLSRSSTTYLVFVSFPSKIIVWVAQSGKLQEVSIPLNADELSGEIMAFHKQCSNPAIALEKVKVTARRLYEQLLGPLEGVLDKSTILAIDSDDTMSNLPWAALMDRENKYLGQTYALLGLPNLLQKYSQLSPESVANSTALIAIPGGAVVNGTAFLPLPGATEEASFIMELFPRSRILQGARSNKRDLLQLLPGTWLFHFAGHATTHDFGGELLLGESNSAEVFSAETIDRLYLRKHPLIVLSACSTATVNTGGSRDSYGLVRAFLNAGSSTVLASEWDVDSEATNALMRAFYSSLRESLRPELALQHARVQLSLNPVTAHPYYWSAFQLFGGE